MAKKRIVVQRKHIKAGKRLSFRFCPIALAMKDAGLEKPVVHNTSWEVADGSWGFLPRKAERFVKAFDSLVPVKPFSFTLTVVRVSEKSSTP